MIGSEKQQLIDALSLDTARLLAEWELLKDIDMERRAILGYANIANSNGRKSVQWNQWWQRDLRAAWEAIGRDWREPATVHAVYATPNFLYSSGACAKLGPRWSQPLRAVARDALLMSAGIVAYGDVHHPTCQHAVSRWKMWQENAFVLGDQRNSILSIPFVDKPKR